MTIDKNQAAITLPPTDHSTSGPGLVTNKTAATDYDRLKVEASFDVSFSTDVSELNDIFDCQFEDMIEAMQVLSNDAKQAGPVVQAGPVAGATQQTTIPDRRSEYSSVMDIPRLEAGTKESVSSDQLWVKFVDISDPLRTTNPKQGSDLKLVPTTELLSLFDMSHPSLALQEKLTQQRFKGFNYSEMLSRTIKIEIHAEIGLEVLRDIQVNTSVQSLRRLQQIYKTNASFYFKISKDFQLITGSATEGDYLKSRSDQILTVQFDKKLHGSDAARIGAVKERIMEAIKFVDYQEVGSFHAAKQVELEKKANLGTKSKV